jgi:hypothetical protein
LSSPYTIILIIGTFSIINTVTIINKDVNSAHFEAAAFINEYRRLQKIQNRNTVVTTT